MTTFIVAPAMTIILPPTYDILRAQATQRGVEPRFHGNGFVQLYLSNRDRLHVFHPDLLPTRVSNARIHDHRWDMFSHVLLGCIQHTTYDISPCPVGKWAVNEAPGASNKDHPLMQLPGFQYALVMTGDHWLVVGSRYKFPKRQFHESAADRLTMTLIHKSDDDGLPARIISRAGETPDHAFATQPDTKLMWDAIREAFGTWKET